MPFRPRDSLARIAQGTLLGKIISSATVSGNMDWQNSKRGVRRFDIGGGGGGGGEGHHLVVAVTSKMFASFFPSFSWLVFFWLSA